MPANGVTAAGDKAPSKVKIESFQEFVGRGGLDGVWVGQVTSVDMGCDQNRKVTMFRKRPGKDLRIGSGRTFSDSNRWEVEANRPMRKTYYAKVKANMACVGDKSKNFKYPKDQPL